MKTGCSSISWENAIDFTFFTTECFTKAISNNVLPPLYVSSNASRLQAFHQNAVLIPVSCSPIHLPWCNHPNNIRQTLLLSISLHNYLHSASTSLYLSTSSHYPYNSVPKRLEFGFSPMRSRIKRLSSSVSADMCIITTYCLTFSGPPYVTLHVLSAFRGNAGRITDKTS